MTGQRLVIDLSAGFNQGAGIGRYARSLIGAAYPALTERFDVRLWYAADAPGRPPFADALETELPSSAQVRRARFSRRKIDQLARLPLEIRAEWLTGRFDLCYSPDFTVPGATERPTIVTVHDLAFEVVPEAYPPGLLRYLRRVVPINVHRATLVAVVSRTTRIDVVERYKVAADRVVVIPNAVDSRFFEARPLDAQQRRALGLPEDYLLTVGTIEPRKNYRALLDAQRQAFAVTGRPLVVVGRSGWHNDVEMRLIAELASSGVVIPLLNASDNDLPGLYTGAHALAYVPLYEGFGLPVLEGMAAGTAVVASDIPSIREIAAGLATVVQASSVESIAEGLIHVQRSTEQESSRLRDAARGYSWSQSGTILFDTIATVMEPA